MKMLHRMYRFQGSPVLKPDNLQSTQSQRGRELRSIFRSASYFLGWDFSAEHLVHKPVNLCSHLRRQIIRCGVIFQVKFRPDNQVYYFLVDTVWPVIIDDLEVRSET